LTDRGKCSARKIQSEKTKPPQSFKRIPRGRVENGTGKSRLPKKKGMDGMGSTLKGKKTDTGGQPQNRKRRGVASKVGRKIEGQKIKK